MRGTALSGEKSKNTDCPGSCSRTGLLVPLYAIPGVDWLALVKAKNDHPHVPIIVVINPDNGPGREPSAAYLGGICRLQAAGIRVLGYVHTGYGSRGSDDLKSDIDSYGGWYGTDGILFDEMSNVAGLESYYADLTLYARKKGMTVTVGNPGMDTLPSYVGTVDNLILYDNKDLPSLHLFENWQTKFPKQNFSFVSYGVESFRRDFVLSASRHVGYIYLTEKDSSNPWGRLSKYFETLVEIADSNTREGVS